MFIHGNVRVTVFESDGGWKYCLADVNDDVEPLFSDAYASMAEAKEDGILCLEGRPSRHRTLSQERAEDRRTSWENLIRERQAVIESMQKLLSEQSDMNITALRKPEAKIKSFLNQLEWQLGEYLRVGVSEQLIDLAEKQRPLLLQLDKDVKARLAVKQAARPPRKPALSNSQLTPDLAQKVDLLIRLFAETPVQSKDLSDARFRAASQAALERMLAEGISFGKAIGGLDFLNQPEAEFRSFLSKVDQDLAWQCETVTGCFLTYLETGDAPAPHYPMRVAILLHKAKDLDRERAFLAAWCRHFEKQRGGATYDKLADRAKAIGAI